MKNFMKIIMGYVKGFLVSLAAIVILAVIVIAFILGYLLNMYFTEPVPAATVQDNSESASQIEEKHEPDIMYWTCSMHPQIRMPDNTKKCPICSMDLIPVYAESGGAADDGSATILTMSEAAMKLAEIETTPVIRMMPAVEVRMYGKVDYDETRLSYISAYFAGRLDRLFVDYTGITVHKGDHLAEIYSPELYAAQEELIQALASVTNLKDSESEFVRNTAQSMVKATREKLRLWGLTEQQIKEIETSKSATDHMTIYAPVGGIVVHKNAVEGTYVQTGTLIYTLADLSNVWVKLDAYESDLVWLRYGQNVEFTTEAYPGETFTGKISFIDPILNEKTRTVKLRVNVDNSLGKLKPGMFTRAVVRPVVNSNGSIVNTELAGKWISPMHPEIIKDGPGTCDVCGMDLVPIEEMGIVTKAQDIQPPIVIPASAAMVTGTRAIVYVKVPDSKRPTFEGREVVLGPKAGNYYMVKSGLEVDELVVTNGAFKIDSALQLAVKPSMMSAITPQVTDKIINKRITVPEEFLSEIQTVYDAYFPLWESLANDDFDKFKAEAGKLHTAVKAVNSSGLSDDANEVWKAASSKLMAKAEHIQHLADINAERELFETYSTAIINLVERFGISSASTDVHIAYCPMAFDNQGAYWLQTNKDILNPYFGDMMLQCGEITKSITAPADSSTEGGNGNDH